MRRKEVDASLHSLLWFNLVNPDKLDPNYRFYTKSVNKHKKNSSDLAVYRIMANKFITYYVSLKSVFFKLMNRLIMLKVMKLALPEGEIQK